MALPMRALTGTRQSSGRAGGGPAAANGAGPSAAKATASGQGQAAAQAAPQTAQAAMQTGQTGTAPPAIAAPASSKVPLQPPPAGFDVAARSHEVLTHLNAVIRYYRFAISPAEPVQKVGEPSDLLYREQAIADATQAAQYAFQSGSAEATLLQAYAKRTGTQTAAPADGEAQRLQTYRSSIADRTNALRDQQKTVEAALTHAKRSQVAALEQQKEELDGALELNMAMSDALGKVTTLSDSQANTGLAGEIDRLERAAPELLSGKGKPVVSPPLESLSSARSAGVSSQAVVLFQLLGTRRAIDNWISEVGELRAQAIAVRAPLSSIARDLVQRGQRLSAETQTPVPAVSPAVKTGGAVKASGGATAVSVQQQLLETRQSFDSVVATFKTLSAASVPLSQEIITLEDSRSNLNSWRTAVDSEYNTVLRALLLRVLAIALALGLVAVLGDVWRRATVRYVQDTRRRRQLLVMRRVVVGFLSGLVLIFGFVTQFNSLATFAGFITAGIAVGLQTILLSVAAYFFIVGRYGVRVGDRITIATVTGDVIDVGLVRFYLMELAGDGNELHPTGRVAVFSNAVLFQAGTPLYKQMPGTEYAWHELIVKLSAQANYGAAAETILKTVQGIYESYRARIDSQHRAVELWMDTPVEAPTIDSRLQLLDDGLQLRVRFPVEIREAASIDERLTESLLKLMSGDEAIKTAVTGAPLIKALVKG